MTKRPYTLLLPLLALISVLLLSFFGNNDRADWDPDAGLIIPYTHHARLEASSNQAMISNIVDNDFNSAWQSGAPLPEAFISKNHQNILLGKASAMFVGTAPTGLQKLTDGDLATFCTFRRDMSAVSAVFDFKQVTALRSLSLKCQVGDKLSVKVLEADGQGWVEIGTYLATENYSLQRYELPNLRVRSIQLSSPSSFDLFEMAGLEGPPKEYALLDFGQTVPVGHIQIRHWAGEGAATQTKLYLSTDQLEWKEVSNLEPALPHAVSVLVSPEIKARYLKVEHTLEAKDWNKVFIWEIKAYDRFGPYGQRPNAVAGHTKIKDLLGINGYWSWGTDQYSDLLAPDGGPFRYQPVAGHARNYHDMTWDVKSPAGKINFEEMAAGKGTPAKEWLNWDREYGAWHDAGLTIQASLQFYNFKPESWQAPFQEAHDYAAAFVSHFGLKKGNGLVCTIEAGNEPWKYPADLYKSILFGMATGAKQADPSVEVFPCALQAADPSTELSDVFKNYMGARISPEAASLLDGINIHAYSYATANNGKRKAVHPEHPNSSFWEILNAIRWRDKNMPGKKIYLSEWGWDHDGGGEDCSHDECVDETAAACYAVRGALIALRLGLDRATWYFYANEKKSSSLYTRSGLTSSQVKGFVKKRSFFALQSLVALAGGQYFLKTIQEDEKAWVYLLGNADGTPTHLVGWRPDEAGSQGVSLVHWKTGYKPKGAYLLNGSGPMGEPVALPGLNAKGEWQLEFSPQPLLVVLSK